MVAVTTQAVRCSQALGEEDEDNTHERLTNELCVQVAATVLTSSSQRQEGRRCYLSFRTIVEPVGMGRKREMTGPGYISPLTSRERHLMHHSAPPALASDTQPSGHGISKSPSHNEQKILGPDSNQTSPGYSPVRALDQTLRHSLRGKTGSGRGTPSNPIVSKYDLPEGSAAAVCLKRTIFICSSSFCCCLIIAMLVVSGIFIVRSASHACDTSSCRAYAGLLKRFVEKNADPCTNFYQFVCSSWSRLFNRSVIWEHHEQLIYRTQQDLGRLPIKGQSAVEKAAKYYQTCTKASSEAVQFRSMLINANITWINPPAQTDLIEMMSYAAVNWDVTPLLQISLSTLPNGSSLIELAPGQFISVWEQTRAQMIKEESYFSYYTKAWKFMNGSTPPRSAFDTFKAREDRIMESLSSKFQSNDTTLLSDSEFRHKKEAHRWKKLFQDVLRISPREPTVIAVRPATFFEQLEFIRAAEGERQMVKFFSWGVFFMLGQLFLPDMTSIAYKSAEKRKETLNYRCLLHVEKYMSLAVAIPILREKVPRDSFQNIKTIFKGIYRRLQEHMVFNSNADFEAYMEDRLSSDIFSGYDNSPSQIEEYYSQYSEIGSSFLVNMLNSIAAWRNRTSNEYSTTYLDSTKCYTPFRTVTNVTTICPPLMTLPFYSFTSVPAIRIGGLGSLVLASIMEDLFFNAAQRLTPQIHKRLTDSKQCLQETTSGLEGLSDHTIHNSLAGNILYRAYDSIVEEEKRVGRNVKPETEETVYGVTYNARQLLFIASCIIRCGGTTSEDVCNAPVQNNAYFADVFSCSTSKPMNPRKKCNMF
ncbi:neprilysin-1-like [Ornithodoros turicata]|uniref:neprilysin-1-like n=1 Tax=Ornithodoros turicata TaxID=34597 RepID=UPI003138DBFA